MMYIIYFYSKYVECLLCFYCIDRVIIDKTNKGNDLHSSAYFLPCNAIGYSIFTNQCIWLVVRTIGEYIITEDPSLQDERRSWKYHAKETIAAPKHPPVLMKRTISTPRMFAQAGLSTMCKRFMTPNKVSRMGMRRDLRCLFIDCPFSCSIWLEILS